MLRATSPATKAWTWPAVSARTTTRSRTSVGSSPGAVTDRDVGGQLGDRHVDDGELIGTRVRRRVARPQDPGEGFAVVGEAEHRVEPEPALVVRRRALLVLGVDLDQRRVDVQHHRPRRRRRRPHRRSGLGARRAQRVEHDRVDGVEAAPDRRVRRHRAEQRRLITQRRHVRHTASAGGEHHRHLGQQPAPVMDRGTLTGPRDRRRIRRRQPDPIGQFAEHVRPDQLRRRAVPAGHPQPLNRRCSVHLASALQVPGS